jgi:hypothetical protein
VHEGEVAEMHGAFGDEQDEQLLDFHLGFGGGEFGQGAAAGEEGEDLVHHRLVGEAEVDDRLEEGEKGQAVRGAAGVADLFEEAEADLVGEYWDVIFEHFDRLLHLLSRDKGTFFIMLCFLFIWVLALLSSYFSMAAWFIIKYILCYFLRRAREWESEAKVGIRVGRGGSLWVGNRTGVEDGSEKMGDFEKKYRRLFSLKLEL